MCDVFAPLLSLILRRTTFLTVLLLTCLAASGCGVLGIKKEVKVTPLLGPLVEATPEQMLAEINRLAAVRSIRGKVDIQFLDTSFAECGIVDKYRSVDGNIVLERPGKIFLRIQVPFVGQDIAQMTSDGEHFRVAVLMGEEKHRRFLRGTNAANYPRIKDEQAAAKCGEDGKSKAVNERRVVSAFSGLRPQHFTDALLVRPVQRENADYLYVMSETFEEEPDPRPQAKRGARVVNAYYLIEEIAPKNNAAGDMPHVLRRFWFDRYGAVRLKRLQTFNERGQIATDVLFEDAKKIGESGQYTLPARVVLTRPQDHYSLQVSYQAPEAVVVNNEYPTELFVLENKAQLPEVDLDQMKK